MSESATESDSLLVVENLSVSFVHPLGETHVTKDVSFTVAPGERVGMVGESGCGKSVTGLALLGLLPVHAARVRGQVYFQGKDLVRLPPRELQRIRGKEISMIFQEPMVALDPVFTIGYQLIETLRCHENITKREARDRAIDTLAAVGIPSPGLRIDEYPHQFSGGMRQRAMIAMALICQPKLIIADEPTTALDVTVQAQIIDLICELSATTGTAVLLITHDLGVVSETCTRLLTMYAGELVESSPMDPVLYRPAHPYTSGLLQSLPGLARRGQDFPSIPGRVPAPDEMLAGCRFKERCIYATTECDQPQALRKFGPDRSVRCWRASDLTLPGAVPSLSLAKASS